MTRKQADAFMNERFDDYANKARTADTDEEREHFTDAAHKLYITLVSAGAFEEEPNNGFPMYGSNLKS